MPERQLYGVFAFKRIEDAVMAYIEITSSKYTGLMWRAKTYHKMRVANTLKVMFDKVWPEDVEMVTDYNIYGPAGVAEEMDEIAKSIMRKHHGFWRDDIPSLTEIAQKHHEAMAKYVGMALFIATASGMAAWGFGSSPLIHNPSQQPRSCLSPHV